MIIIQRYLDLDVIPLKNKTASEVINKLKNIFCIHGLPRKTIADNMPLIHSHLNNFVLHLTFSLLQAAPNTRSQMDLRRDSFRQIMKKCTETNTELWLAIKGMELSSVKLLMNHKTRTLLPGQEALFKIQFVSSVKRNLVTRNE